MFWHVTVALGDFVYVMGGKDGDTVLDSAARYDTRANAWEAVAAAPS